MKKINLEVGFIHKMLLQDDLSGKIFAFIGGIDICMIRASFNCIGCEKIVRKLGSEAGVGGHKTVDFDYETIFLN